MVEDVLQGSGVTVVAEVSANHLGSRAKVRDLVSAIADAGCRVVKFQHYKPESLTLNTSHRDFVVKSGSLWDGRTLHDLYSEGSMPWQWTEFLAEHCRSLGLEWFSTPFDMEAADFLLEFDVPVFKVASFELVDIPFLIALGSRAKPIFLSTGMATGEEIDLAVSALLQTRCPSLALLRCNSGYPAVADEMNLLSIPEMKSRWGVPVGLSDHTRTNTSAVVAVSLGACMIEKHVTLRRSDGGPDAEFSLEPSELAQLVEVVDEAHKALGSVTFGPTERESASMLFRRSLRVSRNLRVGDIFSEENVRSVRPSGGLSPIELPLILGRRAAMDLVVGDPLTWAAIDLDGLPD